MDQYQQSVRGRCCFLAARCSSVRLLTPHKVCECGCQRPATPSVVCAFGVNCGTSISAMESRSSYSLTLTCANRSTACHGIFGLLCQYAFRVHACQRPALSRDRLQYAAFTMQRTSVIQGVVLYNMGAPVLSTIDLTIGLTDPPAAPSTKCCCVEAVIDRSTPTIRQAACNQYHKYTDASTMFSPKAVHCLGANGTCIQVALRNASMRVHRFTLVTSTICCM